MALLDRLCSIPIHLFTFFYYGPLHHYTIGPVKEFEHDQADLQRVRKLLCRFKSQKEQELEFVKKATALSAGVVIGVFSWSSVNSSFWLAQLFWYCSLWFSVFALVSFSQQKMLDQIHDIDTKNDLDCTKEEQLKHLLLLFLRPRHGFRKRDAEEGRDDSRLVPDWKLVWVWQTPMMFMSFSWVCVIIGYFLYFLTPLLAQSEGTAIDKAIAIPAIVVGLLALLNFELSSFLSHKAIQAVKKHERTMSNSIVSEKTLTESSKTGERTEDSDGIRSEEQIIKN